MRSFGSIDVVSVRLSYCDDDMERWCAFLSLDEKKRAESFAVKRSKEQFILCRSILRQTLGKYLDADPVSLVFEQNENGKPFLKNNDLRFNISHSRNRLLIAIAFNKKFGVDVEFKRGSIDMEAIAKRWFSKREYVFFKESENQQDAFFNIWTRKEAYIKALGSGIFKDLKSVDVPLKIPSFGEKGEWFFQTLEIDSDYSASLVYEAPETPIIIKHADEFIIR